MDDDIAVIIKNAAPAWIRPDRDFFNQANAIWHSEINGLICFEWCAETLSSYEPIYLSNIECSIGQVSFAAIQFRNDADMMAFLLRWVCVWLLWWFEPRELY